jgi:hypothetical protein
MQPVDWMEQVYYAAQPTYGHYTPGWFVRLER